MENLSEQFTENTDLDLLIEDFSLFGFNLSTVHRKKKDSSKGDKEETEDGDAPVSFVEPDTNDGSAIHNVQPGGAHQVGYLFDSYSQSKFKSDKERILKYREISQFPEVSYAVDEIANEVIVSDDEELPVKINFSDPDNKISKKLKDTIEEEFDESLKLLRFIENGHDIFRTWYIDGKKVYHIILNEKKDNIVELREIDPTKIKKVKEVEESIDPNTGVKVYKTKREYFVYSDGSSTNNLGVHGSKNNQVIEVEKDSLIYVTSGLFDEQKKNIISHLEKAIKTANQLRMLEDAMVIYRLTRAPERRVFYIDVGNLPAKKAEAYLQNVIAKFRNKISYDTTTGELVDKRQQMAMIEDFWLPRKSDGRSTQVDTLPSGQLQSQLDDIEYFKKKLYKALNVPMNRLEQEATFTLGRSSEITRDELRFQKFVSRLRAKFSTLFYQLLKTQLILKKIISLDEWEEIKHLIFVDFIRDNHFTEMKDAEIIRERLGTLREINDYTNKYFSVDWIRRNVLKQTDQEIDEIDKQIEEEKKKYADDDAQGTGRF